jgi:phosphoglycolate phosphatase
MAISKTPTVVFDLDGTLVHTVPDIAAALDIALAPYNVPPTSAAEAATMMGDGLSEFFWRALVSKRVNLPALEADAAMKRFIKTYSESPAELSEAYPGIRELLIELRGLGALMAVCTNKIEPIALEILERLQLREFFNAVVGYRDDRPMKPHPYPILEAVSRSGGHIERTLLVGDTGADSGAAIAARIPLILVSYGYSAFPIGTLRYGTIVDNPRSLRDEIIAFLGANLNARTRSPLNMEVPYPLKDHSAD